VGDEGTVKSWDRSTVGRSSEEATSSSNYHATPTKTGLPCSQGSGGSGLHAKCRYAILSSLRHACGGVRVLGSNWCSKRAHAGVAQLVEHLICNQRVGGSSPFASSKITASARLVKKVDAAIR
jgi:hypothetical protein